MNKDRINWELVNTLLKNKVDEKSEQWADVIKTNVCVSWYNFMLTRV